MKKLYATIIILVAIVGGSYLWDSSSENAQSQEDEPIKIGMLQYMSHPSLDQISQGTIDQLEERGYIDGENIDLNFFNAQGDQSNMNTISDQFINDGAELMIGVTTPASQALANASSERPIILGAVTDPEHAGLVESNEEPGGNITGISDMTPVEEQIQLIRTLLPDAENLGIMYSTSEDNSILQGDIGEEIAPEYGFNPVVSTVSSTNDVAQVTTSLVNNVDAIWVVNDNTVASAFPTLLEQTDKAKIPVFPAVDMMVAQGGLATYGLNQYEIGIATGDITADVLEGADPATTPIRRAQEVDLVINYEKSEEFGIEIPEDMKENAIDSKTLLEEDEE